jgi:hypothetical protein
MANSQGNLRPSSLRLTPRRSPLSYSPRDPQRKPLVDSLATTRPHAHASVSLYVSLLSDFHFDVGWSCSPSHVVLTNYSILSPLKRQRAVRNRSNNATPGPTPSSRANRLPALPEHLGAGDQETHYSLMSSFPGLCSSNPPPCPRSSQEKRLSRYGKDEFARFCGGTTAADGCPSTGSRTTPRASSSSVKQMHRSVRLSTFDIFLDASLSEPSSPVSETSLASSPPRRRDRRPSSPLRARSPTPSLTSMSACSSSEMPTTPGTSDDEWSGLQLPRKAVARPPISPRPAVVSYSTPSPPISEATSSATLEFTFESFFQLGPEDEESEEELEEEEEDEVLWYSQELGQVVFLSSPHAPSNSPARRDSFVPSPRSSSTGTDRLTGRSRMSKPLPDLPPASLPSAQMDPTFPRRFKSRPLPLPLPSPLHLAPPPSRFAPTRPAVPAATLEPRRLPGTPTYVVSRASSRRPLSIVVPRALPHTPLPLDVSDILDDIDAWSFATPTSTSAHTLSPPRVPHSPASSPFWAEYDPIELIVSYASQLDSPIVSTPTVTCAPVTPPLPNPKEVDESAEVEEGWAEWDDNKLRSRWSCSTLATLAPSASPPRTPTSTSARLRMHLGSVARRVRARRAGGRGSTNGSEDAATVPKAAAHFRSASESASGAVYDSEAGTFLSLQRKPIPLELFSL